MKNIFLVFSLTLINFSNAYAWRIGPIKGNDPKIPLPNSGAITNAIGNATGLSSIQCQRDRDDAERYQSELNSNYSGLKAHLNDNNNYLAKVLQKIEKQISEKTKIENQKSLLSGFQKVSNGLIINEQNLESAIFNLHSMNSAQSLDEILQAMENDSKNRDLQNFAALVRQISQKNSEQLTDILEMDEGKLLLQQLNSLIGVVQVLLAQQEASYDESVRINSEEIALYQKRKSDLEAQMRQNRAEWAKQEERKACK